MLQRARKIISWSCMETYNRSKSSVRIFADPSSSTSEPDAILDVLEKNSDGYFDVVNDAYEIPAKETTYEYVCKSYDELKQQFGKDTDVTIIATTSIITEETRQFVHHFNVAALPSCKKVNDVFMQEQIFGLTPGQQGMVLPVDVGFPMFTSENNQAILIEIHYNNPKKISGMMDSSGVRFQYQQAKIV
eukprot:scaffold101_cov80-Skeletonema_menzelii.AAC.15